MTKTFPEVNVVSPREFNGLENKLNFALNEITVLQDRVRQLERYLKKQPNILTMFEWKPDFLGEKDE
jgi:hypothetical protein